MKFLARRLFYPVRQKDKDSVNLIWETQRKRCSIVYLSFESLIKN